MLICFARLALLRGMGLSARMRKMSSRLPIRTTEVRSGCCSHHSVSSSLQKACSMLTSR